MYGYKNKYMEGFGLVLDWFWSCVWLCGCWSTGELDLKMVPWRNRFVFTFEMLA